MISVPRMWVTVPQTADWTGPLSQTWFTAPESEVASRLARRAPPSDLPRKSREFGAKPNAGGYKPSGIVEKEPYQLWASDRFWPERPTIQAVSRQSDPQTAVAVADSAVGLPSNEERARELATRAASGDLAATQEFLAYVWPTLTRVAAGVLGARHAELDDAVQQSMIALVRALPAFRGECHPAGYASRITLRVALRARRNVKRDATRRETLEQLSSGDDSAVALDGPSDETLGSRRRELLRELLEDLPEEQAEALTLRVVMGWSLEEVARASGAPVNTVRSRVRLAKEALRARIEAQPALAELREAP